MFLGFLLAAIPIFGSQKTATAVALLVPIIALGIPIFDTTVAVVRRSLRGEHPFDPDREHIHHRLLAMGLTQGQVALTLYGVSAVLTILAIWMTNASRVGALLILGFLGLAGVIGIRRLGMDEIMALWGILRHGERRRRSPRHRSLLVRNTVPLLDRCETVAALKALLEEVRRGLEFQSLTVCLNDGCRVSDFPPSPGLVLVGKHELPTPGEASPPSAVQTIGPVDILLREPNNHHGPGNGRWNGIASRERREASRETRVMGQVVATKPAWKRRRTSENDEDLLHLLADALAQWLTRHAASPP
jgi:hypothetical protein